MISYRCGGGTATRTWNIGQPCIAICSVAWSTENLEREHLSLRASVHYRSGVYKHQGAVLAAVRLWDDLRVIYAYQEKAGFLTRPTDRFVPTDLARTTWFDRPTRVYLTFPTRPDWTDPPFPLPYSTIWFDPLNLTRLTRQLSRSGHVFVWGNFA